MKATILIVDDDASLRENFCAVLGEQYQVELASNQREAHDRLTGGEIDLVLLDLHLHGRAHDRSGFAILKAIRLEYAWPIGVIMFTVENDVATAVEAMQLGADHYLLKSCSDAELKLWVQRILENVSLKRRQLMSDQQQEDELDAIIGLSPALTRILADVDKLADRDTAVLITGESGTGKELIARRLHERSWRAEQKLPFVPINCAAIPEALAESDLFGHYPGAFTGATKRRLGKFEFAGQGTIFLDEIDSMPLALQAKLLRALDAKVFTPLGSNQEIRLRGRVVAAAKNDLQKAIVASNFREDLYYRLKGASFNLPPLRERLEDIPHLAQYFIQKLNHQRGRFIENATEEALAILKRYHWPGNIRELYHEIERVFDLAEPGELLITPAMLSDYVRQILPAAAPELSRNFWEGRPMPQVLAAMQQQMIAAALDEAGGNVTQAAKILGISRRGLQKMLQRYHGADEADLNS
jgi:DNA-binding NtrC family response regulator